MLLVLPVIAGLVNGCARTDTSTTTTTAITTTTAATTTTTTTGSCANCDPAIVVPMADPNTPGSHPPTTALGPPQAGTGCATLLVTCTAQPPNGASLLTFFAAADGRDLGEAAQGNPAIGTLICNTAGEWIYTANDINGNPFSVAVGSASCLG